MILDMFSLKGKVAIVTGSDTGLGQGISKAFVEAGAKVLGVSRSASKATQEMLGEENFSYVTADLSSLDPIETIINTAVEKYGRLDILVNNAGITKDNLIIGMKEEDFDAVINTNLKGTFNTVRHFSKYMLKNRWGRIINIASISGVMGNAGQANYSASKAGVIGLTRSVAKELARKGITVNAVAPGYVDTQMTEALSDKAREGIMAQIPAGRGGSVEDIANTVAFLASDKAEYITGQVIEVNGGMH